MLRTSPPSRQTPHMYENLRLADNFHRNSLSDPQLVSAAFTCAQAVQIDRHAYRHIDMFVHPCMLANLCLCLHLTLFSLITVQTRTSRRLLLGAHAHVHVHASHYLVKPSSSPCMQDGLPVGLPFLPNTEGHQQLRSLAHEGRLGCDGSGFHMWCPRFRDGWLRVVCKTY